jgi:hypothetical protein
MYATMVWKVDELGNKLHVLWMIAKDGAEECCVVAHVPGLTYTELEGEHTTVSTGHLYVSDGHWQEHLASR